MRVLFAVILFGIHSLLLAQKDIPHLFENVIERLDSTNQIGSFKLFYIEVLETDSIQVYNIGYVMNQSETDNWNILGTINFNTKTLFVINHWGDYFIDNLDEELFLKEKRLLVEDNPPWTVTLYRRNNALITLHGNQIHIKYLSEFRNSKEYYTYFSLNLNRMRIDSIRIEDFDIDEVVEKIINEREKNNRN
jgi:hypothetical protein